MGNRISIPRELYEMEKRTAYIRGSMDTMELVQNKIDQAKREVEAEMFGGMWKDFCDGYTNCEGCPYDTDEAECFDRFVSDWKSEHGKGKP